MNCKELAEFLLDYVEGTLPPDHAATFEEHLQVCPPCIHYLETYKLCIRLEKACLAGEDDPNPGQMPEALVQAILAARKAAG